MAAKPLHDTLIHCEACGEDYSATYRRCPFCGARNDPRRTSGRDDPKSSSRYIPTPPPAQEQRNSKADLDDTYIFDGQDIFDEEPEEEYYAPRPKGGKRLAPKEGGGFEMPPVNWPRLITFLCSLIIIVAALVIVFTFIYPQLHKDPGPKASAPADISAAPSLDPNPPYSADPDPTLSPDAAASADPAIPSAEPSAPVTTPPPTTPTGTPATIVNASGGLRVRSGPGTAYEVLATLFNGNPINVIAPADNGWYNISFAGSGGATMTGYIMGDYISTIAGGESTTTPPPSTNTQTPSTGGNPTVGRTGTIVGADGGLNVRPDPSRNNPPIASLLNGNTVNVVADAGGGWYEITFTAVGGVTTTGYMKGEFLANS